MRVERSFAFVDLSGFTALTAQRGDEPAVTLLSSFRAILREVCSRRGVRIAKWLGDGAMLVSVDPTALLAALLEMEHAMRTLNFELRARSGATQGEVILHEGDDYIGHPVNVAARLCDVAPDDEIYVTTEMAEERPAWATVSEPFEIEVKGFVDPLEVVSLGFKALGTEAQACPICGIPLTPEVAFSKAVDAVGLPVLFCAESCQETWERRPRVRGDGQGSLRSPLMGF
jgi:adenylate cyclase